MKQNIPLSLIGNFSVKRTILFLILFTSSFLRAQDATLRMDMEWLSSTTNAADFQIRLTNLGSSAVTFNALIIRGVHAPGLTTGTISWRALNDNTLPGWLNWPNTGTTNLPYNSTTRKLNFSSSNSIFNSSTAQAIPSGAGVVVGTFRISTTTTWSPNSNFGFTWEMTSGGVVGYIDGASSVTNIQHYGVSGGTICGQCLTVTAPSAQLLNQQEVPPSSSILTGDATICAGSSTNLSVAVTGGVSPYTVTVTDGTSNYTATGASPVSIPVSPTSTSTYNIVSVTGGGTGTGNTGSATVTVTPTSTNTTTVTGVNGSYTWANNGQTYTVSGTYTGNDVNCVAQVLNLSINASLRMDMEWLSSTTNAADFQIRLTNLGSSAVTFNALIIRGVHAPGLTTGTISWRALNDNTLPGWLNWPNTGTTNLPYNSTTRKLNFSSSNSIFNSSTAQAIPSGAGVVVGTFRISTTTTWSPNSNFGFTWEMTSGGVVGYVDGATVVTNIQHYGVSGGTICGQCLTVTAPAAQLLNPQVVPPPTSSVLTGDATICSGNSTNLSIAVTDGTAPYTVIVTDGTNNFSATGASPVSIPVSPSATSTYSIVSVTGGGTGTGNTGSATVTVVPAPAATISYTGSPWCSTSTSQTVTQTGTTGGTYSSTTGLSINSSTGTITPSTSTAGTYTVTYTIPATGPCAALSVTTSVTITTAPSATISYASSTFCSSSSTPQSVTQTGTSGGTYSSTTGLTLDASTGAITPSTSTTGSYTVTYTLAASGSCSPVSATTTITIAAAPSASISYVGAPFCKSLTTEQPVTQTGSTGGVYTASPAGLSINASTGAITPSTSTATTAVVIYTVTYSVAASSGCPAVSATTTVSIGPIPSGSISYAGNPFCKTLTTAINVTRSTVPASGGAYTRVPTALVINGSSGQLAPPNTQTAGIYTVTLTLTNVQTGGCGIATFNAPVTITAAPTAVISYVGAPFCKTITTERAVTLTGTAGGTYSASPAGLSINSSTGAITPSTSTAGTYTVSYTTPSGTGCTPITATLSVTITTPPSATISYAGSPFCKTLTTAQSVTRVGTANGTYSASPTGLTFSATLGTVTPSTSTAGTYTVSYTLAATGGCSAVITTATVIITAAPVIGTLSGTQSVCSNSTTTFSSTTVGGTWTSGTTSIATINPSTGVISPVGAGTATMTYTVTGGPGCANATGTRTVTVTALPSATISYAGSPFCKTLTNAQSVTRTGTSGGTYTASPTGLIINASTGAITPSSSSAGTYTVTYTIAGIGGCTLVTTTTSVSITAAPAATISYSGSPWCASSTADQPVTQVGTTGGAYSSATGLSINSITGIITPSTSTAGTYTVAYTIAAALGCAEVVATTNATITATPSQPTLACYQTATFNTTTCSWDLSGTQAAAPTGLACYETATFNNITCVWDVSGTQATAPTVACYETLGSFNTATCSWDVTGTQPLQPVLACYEIAAFNTTSCTWVVIGTQPAQPTLACYETTSFNTTSCTWLVSGTQPVQPALACYETATFNTTSCTWDVTGAQAPAPTGLACYETATFNTTSCSWIVSGSQTTNTTTISSSGSYTWSNNGQTYTTSGTYTGNEINCVAQVLNLTITSALRMDMEWLSSTASTADFQIRLTNTGQIPVTFNALIVRGIHSPSITTGTITWKALNDNTLPGWLNWPNTGTSNLPYISSQRKLNFSSSTGIFTSATAQAIPSGSGVVMGTFRMSTTSSWSPNSDFGFVWEMTSGGVVAYVNGATVVTNIQQYGVTGGQTCGQCLTVTASSAQPLNTITPLSAVLSGDATICAGSSTNLSVAVTGGESPYTVTITDGTNNYTATGTSPLSIAVSPSESSTYSITSVTGGVTGIGTGSATVSVTPVPAPTLLCYQTATLNTSTCSWDITGTQPTQPTLACYQTSTFNETTCAWDVTGTQAAQPTLACYQTATFNTTTCAWDVTGTQAAQPTLACYQTATFNTTTCIWDVTGTQATAPTGLSSWQTAVFNTTTCVWDITGTEPPSSSTLNITMFIQGYYVGASAMTPVKANQGIGSSSTDVDDILVELRNPTTLELVASAQGVLQTNGTAACIFLTSQSGSYYIVVKHRNSIETWSTTPITIGASSSYNFTTSANKAYGDNMKEMEPGVWAFYSGDINQDGFIETSDFPILFNSNDNFEEGYLITDLNGDGYVDSSDYPILFNNSDNFIESIHP
jgi:hypothetical protein